MKDRGKIVAITGLYSPMVHPKNIVWLGWYAVEPRRRGKGLGGKLLRWTERKALNLGFRRMYVVADPRAWGFFEKHGYRRSKSAKLNAWYLPPRCRILYKKLSL